MTDKSVKAVVSNLIKAKYGRVEEELMATGVIDSLRAVELSILLEKEFSLPRDSFMLSDMRFLSSIIKKIQGIHSELQVS